MVESTECSTAVTGGILGLAVVMLANGEDEVSMAGNEVSMAGNDHVILIIQDPRTRKLKIIHSRCFCCYFNNSDQPKQRQVVGVLRPL